MTRRPQEIICADPREESVPKGKMINLHQM